MKRTVVFVKRPGSHKTDDAWACTSESEANNLVRWLQHLGVKGAKTMTLNEHEVLPNITEE